jgi:hypothetical protein
MLKQRYVKININQKEKEKMATTKKETPLKIYCRNENGMVWLTADEAIDLKNVRELKNKQEMNYQELVSKTQKLEKENETLKMALVELTELMKKRGEIL